MLYINFGYIVKKIINLIIILLFTNLCFSNELNLNVKNNLNNIIYKSENVELIYNDKIPVYYSLKKATYISDENTDLYLSFDSELNQGTDNYNIIYKNFHYSENKSIFNKSAYFSGEEKRIELVGNKNSFFQSDINLSSFTISFWIYPLTYSNNEIVLRIGSQYFNLEKNTVEDQSIYAKMADGRLSWDFVNLFSSYNVKKSIIKLESYNRLTPEKWNHINLNYDSNTGIIKCYINGNEEAVIVATEDNKKNSTIMNLKFNKANRCILTIAPSFYGAIDEFSIIKNDQLSNDKLFESHTGQIISKVHNFAPGGIILEKIKTIEEKDFKSDIFYYIRYSNEPFDNDDTFSSDIKWHLLNNNFNLIKFKYFQWKVLLYAGEDNNFSPKFKSITLVYKNNEPPAKPSGLQIVLDGNNVKLKWFFNQENDLKGYKLYYGTKSNYYFSTDANEGKSPIDIGLTDKFTISGLKNSFIYYFTITAYDDDEHAHESDFSEEVYIRPYLIK